MLIRHRHYGLFLNPWVKTHGYANKKLNNSYIKTVNVNLAPTLWAILNPWVKTHVYANKKINNSYKKRSMLFRH
jgi:hypothetical protein